MDAGVAAVTGAAGRDGVHRFLVTTSDDNRLDLWRASGIYANWIEGRPTPDGDRETWLVTVMAEQAEQFLTAARAISATIEEIDGAGDNETYTLRVGEPGTGWHS